MNGELAGEGVASLRSLYWIDVPDHVGDRDVGRRQLLDIAFIPEPVGDRGFVSHFSHEVPASSAYRPEGIIVDLAALDAGNRFIQEVGQLPQDAALGLTAETQQDHVVSGEDCVDHVGNDRVLIPHDSGEDRLPILEFSDEIEPHLILDRSPAAACLTVWARLKFSQRLWLHPDSACLSVPSH